MERSEWRSNGPGNGRGRGRDRAGRISLHGKLYGAEPGKRPRSRGRISVLGANRRPITTAIPATFEWTARCGDRCAFNNQRRSDGTWNSESRVWRARRRSSSATEQQQPERGNRAGDGDDPGGLR